MSNNFVRNFFMGIFAMQLSNGIDIIFVNTHDMDWNRLLNNNRLRQSTRSNPNDARNDFESDFGRIVFSPALRRMHDKTQVFPLTTDDNIHSRLTHSMEVLSIAYSMGVKLCEDTKMQQKLKKDKYDLFREIPIILKNSSLLHDIGNPPFGHFGETVIQQYFKDLFEKSIVKENGSFSPEDTESSKLLLSLSENEKNDFLYFDGNAQGLRVMTKLQILDDLFGLNLTYATLGAYIKYPNYEKPNKKDEFIERHKLGIFQSELAYFKEISNECGTIINGRHVRHPLCYLMEAADSICYLTMDIEDGFNKGLFDIEYLVKELKEVDIVKEKIQKINRDITNDTTRIVRIRIELIQQLVNHAVERFISNISAIEDGNFNEELILSSDFNLPKILQKICREKIFSQREINSLEITGHSVMSGILDYYIDFLFRKSKDYKKRAEILISSSIVKAALEENFNAILNNRKSHLKNELSQENNCSIERDLKRIEEIETKLPELKKQLKAEPKNEILEKERKRLNSELKNLVNPKIEDLNDYFKLRVIVDFVSGMTDQYALNHFRRISGQQIN